MIKLQSLFFDSVCLTLTEANSGYTDHKFHKYVSNKLFGGWMELLNEVKNKNDSIDNILNQDADYFKKQIDDGCSFMFEVSEPEINFTGKQKVNVLLAFENDKVNHHITIRGASTNLNGEPVDIYLRINSIHSINDVLAQEDYIKELAHHEIVHLIKHIQGVYQTTISKNVDFISPKRKWIYHQLSQPQEIHAYISQINNELKNTKLKYPNILFSDALSLSKMFYKYERDVFPRNPKLRSKMLSKLANYWNLIPKLK